MKPATPPSSSATKNIPLLFIRRILLLFSSFRTDNDTAPVENKVYTTPTTPTSYIGHNICAQPYSGNLQFPGLVKKPAFMRRQTTHYVDKKNTRTKEFSFLKRPPCWWWRGGRRQRSWLYDGSSGTRVFSARWARCCGSTYYRTKDTINVAVCLCVSLGLFFLG